MAIRNKWERYSIDSLLEGEADRFGRLFVSPLGQVDLSSVRFLHVGVDTVRQLFSGEPLEDALLTVQTAYDAGFKQLVEISGYRWIVGTGGASGYRYRLQNNELGLIAFFGSRYANTEKDGSHLKIECSPHWLLERGAKEISAELLTVARSLLRCPQPTKCAVHVAVDVQGWEPPKDFEDRFVARSKRQARFDGIGGLEFSLAEASAVYGARETFMYGSAGALQFVAYRKDLEARKSDKLHFWKSRWENATDENFKPLLEWGKPIWRIEVRFHQSVVEEFGSVAQTDFRDFVTVSEHLTGLWRFALDSYRLDASRSYVDPFWQLLQEDVQVLAPMQPLVYKRCRKEPGRGNQRNVSIALGNMLSIYARHGFGIKQAMGYLRNSGLWPDVANYLYDRQMTVNEFTQWVERQLCLRRMVGKAA